MRRRRVGVLGGSFNPPHLGHLVIASEAFYQLGLERVVFVPAADPPHKTVADATPAAVRVEMTRLAIAGDERFCVSTIELDRGLKYTVDTLRALAGEYPGAELVFIMGSDSLLQFEAWHEPQAILELCRLAVAVRAGDDERRLDAVAAGLGRRRALVLRTPLIAVSSTDLRSRVRMDMPLTYLVPRAVEEYVRRHDLYVVR
ncbi:MAG: nicotinate (nicotinamide) nucleotide adenylyltransferase [Thermoleophilia bacterium]|nr:nicotinate (nicotinamide) nucleotide adenylyltransferase [Thermoleophilia bacterium]